MTTIQTYIPQDRLRALARGESLPDRTTGSALFADISGFTALTELLRESLGARQGAEELTKHLDTVYTALITEVEKYGGSVLGFAGDAMICWFDEIHSADKGTEHLSALFVVHCAFALQTAMQSLNAIVLPSGKTISLALKVSVTTGPARRFVVGNPDIHYVDALAGTTVARISEAEHLAHKGEIILDEATTKALGVGLTIREWRSTESGEKFAVAEKLSANPTTPSQAATSSLDAQILKAWINKTVYERESVGGESFLIQFRPCVMLFVRFTGIAYDSDTAEAELDRFIRQSQAVASHYDGTLMGISIGDKGSYIYIGFGALSAHEDDMRRAVKTALLLRNKTELQLQMGISQGVMRVGAYGGVTRKTFGALGDDVNLAARLMTTATTGEILLSSHAHKAVQDDFVSEPRSPLPMKGKAEPLSVFAITGERNQRAIRLQEPNYALPMVGRKQELEIINDKLDLVANAKGQVIGIVAEAGMGKSRLVAEVIRLARKKGFVAYGGACQSDALTTPYQAWKGVWQAFFEVDPEISLKKQMRFIEGEVEDRAPSFVDAIPLLNVVLELDIPENDFVKNLEPEIRQTVLHALLEDCLKAAASDEPLLIVIEDMHWIDALSRDLLERLAKALAHLPICFVLAYRPPSAVGVVHAEPTRLEALPQFTRIALRELTQAEAESAIRAKLAQLYPARSGTLPGGLVQTLMARSQGNPFYLEELLNYVRDRGLDPADLNHIELPDSLHTLILSRIDRLSEQEKTTLRVASIIGRLFRAHWLTGYYPTLGSFSQVKESLNQLHALDITPLDSTAQSPQGEPELVYLFKHIVTHEVTYQSLPLTTRTKLHGQLASYLETVEALHVTSLLETLAYHYGRSDNGAKQIEYLRKAGEVAQKNFANEAALDFYGKLLALLKNGQGNAKEHAEIYLQRGKVLELQGKYDEAENDYRAALALADTDLSLKADVLFALGKLNRWSENLTSALKWLAQAQEIRTALQDDAGLAQVFIETGMVLHNKFQPIQAREPLNKGLVLARKAGDKLAAAQALNNLANLARDADFDYATAQALYEESLSLRREIGDKVGISASLSNLGDTALAQWDYPAARVLYEESLKLAREMGYKMGTVYALNALGSLAYIQADYPVAKMLLEDSLSLTREMGVKGGMAAALGSLGRIALVLGNTSEAQVLLEESLSLARQVDHKGGIAGALFDQGYIALGDGEYTTARTLMEESLAIVRELDYKIGIGFSLWGLGSVMLAENDSEKATALYLESLTIAKETNNKPLMACALLGLGLVDISASQNLPETRQHILRSLRLRWEMGERVNQTSSLVGVAGLALQAGDSAQAAQWLGTIDAALKALKVVLDIEVMPFHAKTLTAVRAQLSEADFQSAWEVGNKWSLDDAVKRALDEEGKSATL